jgi:hypothetical protein
MRAEQTVSEMAQVVLSRQARALAQRTGEPLGEALEAVLETTAGRQLEELRGGVHQHEEARYWQANLLFERVSEQAGHPVSPGCTGPGLQSFSRVFIHPTS